VSLQCTDNWVKPWRVPFKELAFFDFGTLKERAGAAAGVRIAFYSTTESLAGAVVPHAETTRIDVCCDGQIYGSLDMADRDRFQFEGLPAGHKLLELWLPQFGGFRLRYLEVDDGASLSPFRDGRPRWITYGSSITHCRDAESPTQTWPAVVAREHRLNLTCLGFGGQCHLDTMVARMIRDLSADFLSMCIGINIQGNNSLNSRTFRPAILGFVKIIREKHPQRPFVILSPICCPEREVTTNVVGFSLEGMREEVAAAVATLREHGDTNVHYVSGLEIFGPDLVDLLSDGLHPNAEGYKVMGRNFLEKVARVYFGPG